MLLGASCPLALAKLNQITEGFSAPKKIIKII